MLSILAALEKTVMLSSGLVQLRVLNAGRSTILLNIKCPQLRKPKAKGNCDKESKLHQKTE